METRQFASSILTAYIKGEIKLENENLINIKIPNSILTFIPLGRKSVSVPVSQISSVGTNFYLDLKMMLLGLFFLVLGIPTLLSLRCFEDFLTGLIFSVLGAATCINSLRVYLSIRNTSGEVVGSSMKVDKKGNVSNRGIPFIIFHKAVAEQIANEINTLCSQRVTDTNVRIQNEALGQTIVNSNKEIVNAINNNK